MPTAVVLLASFGTAIPATAQSGDRARRSLSLGAPARSVALTVQDHEAGTRLVARLGGRRVEEELPAGQAIGSSFQRVVVSANGHAVAVVTSGRREQQVAAALVAVVRGRPAILWTGRLDLYGPDRGERTRTNITTEDRTGDGIRDVVIGTEHEATQVCGRPRTLLFPQAYDPASGRLRAVTLRRTPDQARAEVVASPEPLATAPPRLRVLQMTGASSQLGSPAEAAFLEPPGALTDGDASTTWTEGRSGAGQSEFVVARRGANLPLRAFAIIPVAEGADGSRGRLRTFWLVGDGGDALRVTLPDDPVARPGARFWITPPAPLDWSCVSLVVESVYAPDGVADARVATAIAELEAYTDLDVAGGIERLVNRLVEGGEDGDEVANVLGQLGAEAATAVREAWPRLDTGGMRRAIRVFRTGAADAPRESLAGLRAGMADDAPSVAVDVIAALRDRVDDPARDYLAEIARRPGDTGDDATEALSSRPVVPGGRRGWVLGHPDDLPRVLGLLEAEGGSDRPAVREALTTFLDRDEGRARFAAWWGGDIAPSARATALLALAGAPSGRAEVDAYLGPVTDQLVEFADRWRALGAAAQVGEGRDPRVDEWVAQLAADGDPWMVRARALRTLSARGAASLVDLARRALDDPYPRVRVAAIEVLPTAEAAEEVAARLDDRWPLVRAAAVRALGEAAVGLDGVRQAIDDRTASVRVAALEAATRASDAEAWPAVQRRLTSDDEYPQVSMAALTYVGETCPADPGEILLAVLERGLRPNAWPPDVDLAALAAALAVREGGETAETARERALADGVPVSIRRAAESGSAAIRACD